MAKKWPKKNVRQDMHNQENGSLMQILNVQGQFHHDAASLLYILKRWCTLIVFKIFTMIPFNFAL